MADLIYTSPPETVVVITNDSGDVVLSGTQGQSSVIETESPPSVIETLTQPDALIVTEFARGPQGIPGPPGNTTLYYEAGETLSGHRVVILEDDKLYYADCSVPSHAKRVLGITTGAAMAGAIANVKISGELTEPSWSWDLSAAVWLSTTGLLSQAPPVSGFSLFVGFPVTATKLFIDIREPIILLI